MLALKCYRPTFLIIHNSMSWASHITTVVHKASKTTSSNRVFICVQKKLKKQPTYLTLVRKCLEHALGVWDPYQLYLISDIEKT